MSAMLPIPGRATERRILTIAGAVALGIGAAWAVTTSLAWLADRITSGLESLTFGPSLPIALSAGLVLLGWRAAFRLGRGKQRAAHAVAVWKGHPR